MITSINAAAELLNRVRELSLDSVPVSDFARCEPRTKRAKEFRKLFKQLGLKKISVTAPNYSMAQSIDVRLPEFPDECHDRTRWPHSHSDCCGPNGSDSHDDATRCPACRDRGELRHLIKAILCKAFPNLHDRSDTMADYFDYCWTVN